MAGTIHQTGSGQSRKPASPANGPDTKRNDISAPPQDMKSRSWQFAQSLYCRFQDDEVPAMGAQLTYYLILSFFPFLIFIIAVLSFADLTVQDVIDGIRLVLPETSTSTISEAFQEIQQSRSGSLLSFGLLITLWSASNGVSAVIKALNKAYDVEETRPFWKVKGISLLFTVVLALVIVSSMVMLIFGRVIGDHLYKWTQLPGSFDLIWGIAQYVLPIAIMAVVFALMYMFVPNLHLKFKEVLPGAIFTTLGWIVTSLAFSFYVNHFGSYSKTYGSIGGIIVLLTWLYLSSIVLVIGGEINAVRHFDKNGMQKPACKSFAIHLPFLKKKKA